MITILVAAIAAVASIAATVISARNARSLHESEERFKNQQQSAEFLNEQLKNLYLPVSMHLAATSVLAKTHYGADEETVSDIEKALHVHNRAIIDALMNWTLYLDPDAPESATTGLLGHLLQWETVYEMKMRQQWDAPVWDGIRHFGYDKFPDGAAEYFVRETDQKRKLLSDRLSVETPHPSK